MIASLTPVYKKKLSSNKKSSAIETTVAINLRYLTTSLGKAKCWPVKTLYALETLRKRGAFFSIYIHVHLIQLMHFNVTSTPTPDTRSMQWHP